MKAEEHQIRLRQLARSRFEQFAQTAKVDLKVQGKDVQEVMALEREARARAAERRFLLVLSGCGLLIFLVALAMALTASQALVKPLIAVAVFGAGTMWWTWYLAGKRLGRVYRAQHEVNGKKQAMAARLAPMVGVFDLAVPLEMLAEAEPDLRLEPGVSTELLAEMRREFGWDGAYNESRSALFARGGYVHGHAFAVGTFLTAEWQNRTYVREKALEWRKLEPGADGHRHRVRHTGTVSAKLEKPVPVFAEESVIIYGDGSNQSPVHLMAKPPPAVDLTKVWRLEEYQSAYADFVQARFAALSEAMAPLLALPEAPAATASTELWSGILNRPRPSFWDGEVAANRRGEKTFAPPNCATRAILKARALADGRFAIVAHGYEAESRVQEELCASPDGHRHRLSVVWTEYHPVSGGEKAMQSPMETGEDWQPQGESNSSTKHEKLVS